MVFRRTIFLFLLQHFFIISSHALSDHHSLETDRPTLVEFKKTITADPNSRLSNWNDSTHVCYFTGVVCNKEHHRVWQLNLNDSGIVGPLSPFISNLTHLRVLELVNNHLSAEIPREFSSLQHLQLLLLEGNDIHGQIPDTFSLLVYLTRVRQNRLTGKLPPSFFSNCTLLKNVDLSFNFLEGNIPEIGSCRGLWNLNLYNNQFTGEIPFSITNATSMVNLDVEYNFLSGELPSKMVESLPHLEFLHFSFNALISPENNSNLDPFFTALCNYTSVVELELEGSIPPTLSNLTLLSQLNLTSNLLSGTTPEEISQLPRLQRLFLSHNSLSGPIPAAVGQFQHLVLLDLSNNKFSEGDLPIELSKLENVQEMDLSSNRFTGRVSPQISSCIALSLLNISHNRLEGELPESLGDLKNLEVLDVSVNHLFGTIPTSLSNIRTLKFLNLSVNEFSGTIPSGGIFDSVTNSSFLQNGNLCGSIPELFDATGGFDEHSKLGSGSSGRVYKGVLLNGMLIAVIQLQTGIPTKNFNRECQVLKSIRHRNLIRIITTCSQPDFKALVLPYMANGSLDSRLYSHSGTALSTSGSSDLTLIQRVNICSDIAEGMAYLHHHSPVRVTHRDLKPSNVLLNDNMTALVSDFGIARLVMTVGGGNNSRFGKSTTNMVCGSVGYIAPEYGMGSNMNIKGDVCSFGILVLEMVTRKRPTDNMFAGGLSLHKWVESHYHGQIERAVDPLLVKAMSDQTPEVKKMWEVAIGELTKLGILCSQDSPSTRPTMLDAADDLDRLKRYLMGDATATFASTLGISSSTVGNHTSVQKLVV
ncbi:hypothetical protein RHMOL_Rhmol12G0219500 [Rhododendron molle]|uniref:Uncharacterized protein n=1 Tax=Rhododendron molle TaxID=49168 RepID=A0ACC0LKT7_RHOML|nr:hypothetical protein RHMOL_Rhmol12G0219500 [Rhododendron molle]